MQYGGITTGNNRPTQRGNDIIVYTNEDTDPLLFNNIQQSRFRRAASFSINSPRTGGSVFSFKPSKRSFSMPRPTQPPVHFSRRYNNNRFLQGQRSSRSRSAVSQSDLRRTLRKRPRLSMVMEPGVQRQRISKPRSSDLKMARFVAGQKERSVMNHDIQPIGQAHIPIEQKPSEAPVQMLGGWKKSPNSNMASKQSPSTQQLDWNQISGSSKIDMGPNTLQQGHHGQRWETQSTNEINTIERFNEIPHASSPVAPDHSYIHNTIEHTDLGIEPVNVPDPIQTPKSHPINNPQNVHHVADNTLFQQEQRKPIKEYKQFTQKPTPTIQFVVKPSARIQVPEIKQAVPPVPTNENPMLSNRQLDHVTPNPISPSAKGLIEVETLPNLHSTPTSTSSTQHVNNPQYDFPRAAQQGPQQQTHVKEVPLSAEPNVKMVPKKNADPVSPEINSALKKAMRSTMRTRTTTPNLKPTGKEAVMYVINQLNKGLKITDVKNVYNLILTALIYKRKADLAKLAKTPKIERELKDLDTKLNAIGNNLIKTTMANVLSQQTTTPATTFMTTTEPPTQMIQDPSMMESSINVPTHIDQPFHNQQQVSSQYPQNQNNLQTADRFHQAPEFNRQPIQTPESQDPPLPEYQQNRDHQPKRRGFLGGAIISNKNDPIDPGRSGQMVDRVDRSRPTSNNNMGRLSYPFSRGAHIVHDTLARNTLGHGPTPAPTFENIPHHMDQHQFNNNNHENRRQQEQIPEQPIRSQNAENTHPQYSEQQTHRTVEEPQPTQNQPYHVLKPKQVTQPQRSPQFNTAQPDNYGTHGSGHNNAVSFSALSKSINHPRRPQHQSGQFSVKSFSMNQNNNEGSQNHNRPVNGGGQQFSMSQFSGRNPNFDATTRHTDRGISQNLEGHGSSAFQQNQRVKHLDTPIMSASDGFGRRPELSQVIQDGVKKQPIQKRRMDTAPQNSIYERSKPNSNQPSDVHSMNKQSEANFNTNRDVFKNFDIPPPSRIAAGRFGIAQEPQFRRDSTSNPIETRIKGDFVTQPRPHSQDLHQTNGGFNNDVIRERPNHRNSNWVGQQDTTNQKPLDLQGVTTAMKSHSDSRTRQIQNSLFHEIVEPVVEAPMPTSAPKLPEPHLPIQAPNHQGPLYQPTNEIQKTSVHASQHQIFQRKEVDQQLFTDPKPVQIDPHNNIGNQQSPPNQWKPSLPVYDTQEPSLPVYDTQYMHKPPQPINRRRQSNQERQSNQNNAPVQHSLLDLAQQGNSPPEPQVQPQPNAFEQPNPQQRPQYPEVQQQPIDRQIFPAQDPAPYNPAPHSTPIGGFRHQGNFPFPRVIPVTTTPPTNTPPPQPFGGHNDPMVNNYPEQQPPFFNQGQQNNQFPPGNPGQFPPPEPSAKHHQYPAPDPHGQQQLSLKQGQQRNQQTNKFPPPPEPATSQSQPQGQPTSQFQPQGPTQHQQQQQWKPPTQQQQKPEPPKPKGISFGIGPSMRNFRLPFAGMALPPPPPRTTPPPTQPPTRRTRPPPPMLPPGMP